jgi:hypothetical protein
MQQSSQLLVAGIGSVLSILNPLGQEIKVEKKTETMRKHLLTDATLSCFFVGYSMKLLMYIENDLIDSIAIEANKIVYPGYIGEFIKMLKAKHSLIIKKSLKEPEFLVRRVSVPSSLL